MALVRIACNIFGEVTTNANCQIFYSTSCFHILHFHLTWKLTTLLVCKISSRIVSIAIQGKTFPREAPKIRNTLDGKSRHCSLYKCKMAFFKRAWHKVKVLPHLNPFKSMEPLIRAFKWGIVWVYTSSGFGDTEGQIWKFQKSTFLLIKF